MTHDEFRKIAAAGGPATPEQEEAVREHLGSCPECLSAVTRPATEARAFGWWLAIVAVLFLALWIWREAGIRVAREQLRSDRAEVLELKNAAKVLQEQKEKLATDLAVISAPDVQTIALAGGPTAPSAYGRLFVDRAAQRGVLMTTALAASGPDHDYELWLSGPDGSARSGGIFDVTNSHTTISVPTVPKGLTSVAVTFEKNGGAVRPGPAVVLSGRP